MDKKEIILVLHDVRSVHNVGSIFRTADAAGVKKIYLCSVTPAPLDRMCPARQASYAGRVTPVAENL